MTDNSPGPTRSGSERGWAPQQGRGGDPMKCPAWCAPRSGEGHDHLEQVVRGPMAGCLVRTHDADLVEFTAPGVSVVVSMAVEDVVRVTDLGTVTDRTPAQLVLYVDDPTWLDSVRVSLSADDADRLAGVLSDAAATLRRIGADQ